MAVTNWGQQKESLLFTYEALGRSIAHYAAPVCSTNASDISLGKIQHAQNEALRSITCSHKTSSIDHLHSETKMLLVKDHLHLLSAQFRVLKKRPPPISDEEQRLNRRQRCTLSQLRSGHCHLLQDYKHRVFGEPSDICTDCGASPQDVRHLFACTTHPTDLSPEDLWRNPVGSIRAFSYLDNGNLD